MPTTAAPRPILIDTDIGDDVDDAFALALAVRLPQLRVCGVTTVAGPAHRRAQLAHAILTAAGTAPIPVAPGAERRGDGTALPTRFTHGPAHASPAPAPEAVELILAASHAYRPLTILALGPLTNIAAALQRDPGLARRAQLIAVGGVGGLPYPDWNLRCDPQAARIAVASGIPITLVGLNLTAHCKLWPHQLRRLLASPDPLAARLAAYVLAWRTWKRRMPILHDALAVAAAAMPDLVVTAPRHVSIHGSGVAWMDRKAQANAEVGQSADLARFDALLETALLGAPLMPHARGWQAWLMHQVA